MRLPSGLHFAFGVLLLAVVVGCGGCGGEEVTKTKKIFVPPPPPPPPPPGGGPGRISKVDPFRPNFKLLLNGKPLKAGKTAKAGIQTFPSLVLSPGRATVLQIASYEDPQNETYPALLFWAKIDQSDLKNLKEFQAKVFMIESKGGPVWHSLDLEPVKLKLAKPIEEEIVGTKAGKSTKAGKNAKGGGKNKTDKDKKIEEVKKTGFYLFTVEVASGTMLYSTSGRKSKLSGKFGFKIKSTEEKNDKGKPIPFVSLPVEALKQRVYAPGPSSDNPMVPFPLLFNSDDPKLLLKNIQTRFPKLVQRLKRQKDHRLNGQLAQLNPFDVGRAYMDLRNLNILLDQLLIWGETAGLDYSFRLKPLIKQHNALLSEYKERSEFRTKPLDKVLNELGKLYGPSKKALQNIERLYNTGKIKQAYIEISNIMYRIGSGTVLLKVGDYRAGTFKPFNTLQKKVVTKFKAQQKSAVKAAVQSARRQYKILPPHSVFMDDVSATIDAIQQGDEPEPGIEIFDRWVAQWIKYHVPAVRERALMWAQLASTPKPPRGPNYKNLSKFMVNNLSQLVKEDVARAKPKQARQLYADYLQRIALLLAIHSSKEVVRAKPAGQQGRGFQDLLEASLNKLINKSRELAAEVADYRAATGDLLRWRRRVAEAYARQKKEQYDPLAKRYFSAAQKSNLESRRLIEKNDKSTDKVQLFGPGSAVALYFATSNQLFRRSSEDERIRMGVKVYVSDFLGLRQRQDPYDAISRYSDRFYTQIRLKKQVTADAVASLKSDLLITKDAGPLTLEAAMALVSAERGDLVEAGGRISRLTLESLTRRFATLEPVHDWGFVRLGPLPDEPPQSITDLNIINQVLVRFEIKPDWLRNEYFFVEIKEQDNVAPQEGPPIVNKDPKNGTKVVETNADEQSIQGTWEGISHRFNGGSTTKGRGKFIKFDSGKFFVKTGGSALPKGTNQTYRLDPTQDPKIFDTMIKVGEKEITLKGIYKLEGDTLTICSDARGDNPRPPEFKAARGDGRYLSVYKRLPTPRKTIKKTPPKTPPKTTPKTAN